MEIYEYNNNQAFKAKFTKSDSLQRIAEYAIKHNKFDKLNSARKIIESKDYFVKLRLDTNYNEDTGVATAVVTRFTPVYNLKNGKVVKNWKTNKWKHERQFMDENELGYEIIIKMSKNAPNNDLYKKIVKYILGHITKQ